MGSNGNECDQEKCISCDTIKLSEYLARQVALKYLDPIHGNKCSHQTVFIYIVYWRYRPFLIEILLDRSVKEGKFDESSFGRQCIKIRKELAW